MATDQIDFRPDDSPRSTFRPRSRAQSMTTQLVTETTHASPRRLTDGYAMNKAGAGLELGVGVGASPFSARCQFSNDGTSQANNHHKALGHHTAEGAA